MANLTRAQVKKRIKSLIEHTQMMIEELDDLKSELESEISAIEPYSGFKNLTEVQQSRQEWFDSVAGQIDSIQKRLECPELHNLL